jgi:EmrB/QacA subfamily drug resistance transporter
MTAAMAASATPRPGASPRPPTPAEKRLTVVALLIVFLLSALDQTIVSTAMPRIVAELRGLEVYAWVTTTYLLASTVMVPIWGKLGDMYGRKPVMIWGIAIFVAGSWLCGLAGEFGSLPLLGDGMMQLIIFRGVQGIGGGALFTTAFATIADLFEPRERAKYAGLFGAMFGLAAVVGPIVGGFFTDHGDVDLAGVHIAGWRWVFYINLPLSVLALFMLVAKMPTFGHRSGGRVDLPGAVLIVLALGALMLGLTWGPSDGWAAPIVLGMFAVALVSLLLFLAVERKAANPILPLGLFAAPAFSTSMISSFILSMAFMGTVIFLPLYLQIGLGVGATSSGFAMIPMMAGLIAGATLAGRYVTQTGRYKGVLIGSAGLLVLGLFLMAQLGEASSTMDVVWRLFVVGLGLGPSQSLFNIVAQSSSPPQQVGVATSTVMFLRQTGGMLGVSIFGALLTSELSRGLSTALPGMKVDIGDLERMSIEAQSASGAPASVPPFVATAFSDAMAYIFTASIFIAALALVSMLFIPVIALRGRGPQTNGPAAPAE